MSTFRVLKVPLAFLTVIRTPYKTSRLSLITQVANLRANLFTRKMSTVNLSPDEVARYSRQLILPEIGVEGQKKLKSSSILIVGAGGLGCPAALYLTAAGFGKIGIVDDDVVETSNLHRQVLHNEQRVGMPKVESARQTLVPLNRHVEIEAIKTKLTAQNAIEIVKQFDLVLDATDNAMTRYLLSDVCVLTKKPLISGAALRFEGQLTVYNYDNQSPCYRCLFPNPPPPGTVTNCSDGGVLGVVPGIIGSLQALEAIKIGAGLRPSYAGQMLLFDGTQGTFRNVKIRAKRADCVSCGSNPSIGPGLIDYQAFCGTPICTGPSPAPQGLQILAPEERITCRQYKETVVDKKAEHLLIDVRPQALQDMSKVGHAISIPLAELQKESGLEKLNDLLREHEFAGVYVMCQRGNASQRAVRFLKENMQKLEIDGKDVEIKDLIGGIEAYVEEVDPSIPLY